jgi:hypothetical protein
VEFRGKNFRFDILFLDSAQIDAAAPGNGCFAPRKFLSSNCKPGVAVSERVKMPEVYPPEDI